MKFFEKNFYLAKYNIGHGDNVTKHNFPQKSVLCWILGCQIDRGRKKYTF